MKKPKIKVLLAEDNPGGSLFWQQILAEVRDTEIEFTHVQEFSEISKHIGAEAPDIILLDLSLPLGEGLGVFMSVYKLAPTIPIIVVTATDDQKLAVETALEGAQDSLVKGAISGFLLGRSMRYAIGRQRHLKELNAVSSIDELTGLHNRRGFLAIADQQIKIANQTDKSLLMVFADMDGLKAINDKLGHHWGDIAIMEIAHVLRESFPETDILGRLSGDEFVALLSHSDDINEEYLSNRFQEILDEHNNYPERNFKLSASIGIAPYDPHSPCSAGELLINADLAMYEQKKLKKESVL